MMGGQSEKASLRRHHLTSWQKERGMSHVTPWRRSIQALGTASAKVLRYSMLGQFEDQQRGRR